ncbi:MAG TPA: signal peptidase II [Actinomycetota bacterium]|nr:signal peptidase II [Actinomycetota bacterium]
MDAARRRGGLTLWLTAATVLVCDRLTKLWAERALPDHPRDVVDGILSLRYTTNSGGAFSLGDRAPLVFAVAAIGVCTAIAVTSFRARSGAHAIALGLVLGGAAGNLIDRIARGPGLSGRVVDFIDLHVWPVFNVADASIVVGAALLVVVAFREGAAARDRMTADHDG